jgi:hypothetical protein
MEHLMEHRKMPGHRTQAAQERKTHNPLVPGSSPSGPTSSEKTYNNDAWTKVLDGASGDRMETLKSPL